MTAPLKAIDGTGDAASLTETMAEIGRNARAAARALALAPAEQKNRALAAMAKAIRAAKADILAANAEDIAQARNNGMTGAMLDRLKLTANNIEGIAAGIEMVRDLPDPVGAVMDSWTRPNGMTIERVR